MNQSVVSCPSPVVTLTDGLILTFQRPGHKQLTAGRPPPTTAHAFVITTFSSGFIASMET